MTNKVTFLLVSDATDDYWCAMLKETLTPLGPLYLCSEKETLSLISEQAFTLIIIDAAFVMIPARLVSQIREQHPAIRIVVVTASPTWKQARRIFYAGATDYMRKLLNKKEILSTFRAVLFPPSSCQPLLEQRGGDLK